jgi:hypothetical protein
MTKQLTQVSPHSQDWYREAIIYQVYPRSFLDTNGDGVGDIPGITAKLDYIASLGVDIVWISPYFKSPMKDFGYDISDYCDVDPLFGTLADFDVMIAKAHSLGLKIMIDQVMAHTAEEHPWFKESRSSRDNPKADWYVWSDPRRTAIRRITGCRCSAARRGSGTRAASSTTCITSWSASRSSTSTTRKCSRPTWTRCASGWSAVSTACVWTPPISTSTTRTAQQSAGRQPRHRHRVGREPVRHAGAHLRQEPPENLPFLQKLRALLNEYGPCRSAKWAPTTRWP